MLNGYDNVQTFRSSDLLFFSQFVCAGNIYQQYLVIDDLKFDIFNFMSLMMSSLKRNHLGIRFWNRDAANMSSCVQIAINILYIFLFSSIKFC